MTGVISGIKRMEIHDGDGLRTTVFFKGCPLRCLWCHNPESLSFARQIAFWRHKCISCGTCAGARNEQAAAHCPVNAMEVFGHEYTVEELAGILMQDAPFFQYGGGITLSGGECLAQPEFAVSLAKRLHSEGISVYIDTCGFVKRETLAAILPYTDTFLYDLKAVDAETHKRCTGQDNRLILENLQFLSSAGGRIEIRYPLVMGYNDSECAAIGAFLRDLPGITKIKVLQYHRYSASRYEALGMPCTLPDTQTTVQDVENAVTILKGYGLNAVNGAVSD